MAETQSSLFEKCCNRLDEAEWNYRKDKNGDEDIIVFTATGNDLQMNCIMRFNGEILTLYSRMPVVFEGDKLSDGLMAVNEINKKLALGSLDFDIEDGTVDYRVCNIFSSCTLYDGDIFLNLISLLLSTVDRYNDKLFMLGKGIISLTQFMEEINQ